MGGPVRFPQSDSLRGTTDDAERDRSLSSDACCKGNPDLEIIEPSFTFDVAFGEGVIVRGEPIFPTLSELIEGVEKAVMPLFRFLK